MLKNYLEEILQSTGVNKHQTHIEDEMIAFGKSGLKYIADAIKTIAHDGINEKYTITVKLDGAPAIISGYLPADTVTSNGVSMKKGDFFVGTKSVFNATPKIAPTPDATEALYGGPLGEILKMCHQYLPAVVKSGIYQGDLMYAKIGERGPETKEIDGQMFYTFKPNTIIYAVPVDSDYGKAITASKMGIVMHTKYEGESLEKIMPSFNVSESNFNKSLNVWLTDAKRKTVGAGHLLNSEEATRIEGMANYLFGAIAKISDKFFKILKESFKPSDALMIFINSRIKNGVDKIIDDPKVFLNEFKDWLTIRGEKEIEDAKSDKGKANKAAILQENLDLVNNNEFEFIQFLKIYKVILKAKSQIIRALNDSTQGMQSFLQTENGIQKTNPEGYCIVNIDNKISKFVDRLEFSKANFNTGSFRKK